MKTNTKFTTIYLVRHGETEWNVIRRIQGQKDSPLTSNGINQAAKAADKLKHVKFDIIFSSDLSRTHQTAEILRLDRQIEILVHKALRERTFGSFDGRSAEEFTKITDLLQKEYQGLSEREKWKFKFTEGYESDEEVVLRFTSFLKEVSLAHVGKNLLVVTHGGVIRTFLTYIGFAKFGELNPGSFKNAGYVKIQSDGANFLVEEVEGVKSNHV